MHAAAELSAHDRFGRFKTVGFSNHLAIADAVAPQVFESELLAVVCPALRRNYLRPVSEELDRKLCSSSRGHLQWMRT